MYSPAALTLIVAAYALADSNSHNLDGQMLCQQLERIPEYIGGIPPNHDYLSSSCSRREQCQPQHLVCLPSGKPEAPV
jgi:hypothetical protein